MDFTNITKAEQEYFQDSKEVRQICNQLEACLTSLHYYKTDLLPREIKMLYGKDYVPNAKIIIDGEEKPAYPMVRADVLDIGYNLFLNGLMKRDVFLGMEVFVVVKAGKKYKVRESTVTEIIENSDGIFIKVLGGGSRVWKFNDTATDNFTDSEQKAAFFELTGTKVPTDF